jgi:hypothetical protein
LDNFSEFECTMTPLAMSWNALQAFAVLGGIGIIVVPCHAEHDSSDLKLANDGLTFTTIVAERRPELSKLKHNEGAAAHAGPRARGRNLTALEKGGKQILLDAIKLSELQAADEPTAGTAPRVQPHSWPRRRILEAAGAELNPIVLQIGPTRSATTLAFMSACIGTCISRSANTSCSLCHYDETKSSKKGFAELASRKLGTAPAVCKTHQWAELAQYLKLHMDNPQEGDMLFLTTTEKRMQHAGFNRTFLNEGWRNVAHAVVSSWKANWPFEDHAVLRGAYDAITYVQYTEKLANDGLDAILKDYIETFQLSPVESAAFIEYMTLWDVLRVCCGAQMSRHYRQRLHRNKPPPTTKTSASDFCENHDLGEIERKIISTTVFHRCEGHRVKHLSSKDQILDGTYCERATRATKVLKLDFNDKRYVAIQKGVPSKWDADY